MTIADKLKFLNITLPAVATPAAAAWVQNTMSPINTSPTRMS